MTKPLKATFSVFEHRERAVLAPASVAIVVIFAVLVGGFVALNWTNFERIAAMTSQIEGATDEALAMEWVGRLFSVIGGVFLFLIPVYIVAAAYEAACLRWLIRGEAPGLFGLTLGVDTWRVYSVYWFWFLAHLAVSTAVSIVTMPFIFASMGQVITSGDPHDMMMWQLGVQAPLTLIQYVAMIFVGVRFAPAAALSVARRRFSFFEAWKATRGRFWELLGSFSLIWLLFFAAGAVIFVLAFGPLVAEAWRLFASLGPRPTAGQVDAVFATLLTPANLMRFGLAYALNVPVAILFYLLNYGVNARAAIAALEEGKVAPAA